MTSMISSVLYCLLDKIGSDLMVTLYGIKSMDYRSTDVWTLLYADLFNALHSVH